MSTRDELAGELFKHLPSWLRVDRMTTGVELADALIAEGWRKKPSESELTDVIAQFWAATDNPEYAARAVLALMDRGQ